MYNSVEDALSNIQWPEVSTEVLNGVVNVHTRIHNSVGSFCYHHQAIPDALQEPKANALNQVINWVEEQDQNRVC